MAPLRGLHEGDWKLVDAPEPMLFELSADPGENENLAASERDRVASMQRTLDEFARAGAPGGSGEGLAITNETAAALDALGYTAAQADASRFGSGENPLRHIKDIEKFSLTTRLMTTDPERAKQLLSEIVLAYPEAPGPFFRQMRLLMTKGADDGRIEFCREVLTARPLAMLPRLHLAQLLGRAGMVDDGIGELELLTVQAPDYAAGHLELGGALLGVGDTNGARNHLDTARRLAPRNVAVSDRSRSGGVRRGESGRGGGDSGGGPRNRARFHGGTRRDCPPRSYGLRDLLTTRRIGGCLKRTDHKKTPRHMAGASAEC